MSYSVSVTGAFPAYALQRTTTSSTTRHLTPKRLNGVRLNWFIFGIIFGVAMSFIMHRGATELIAAFTQTDATGQREAPLAASHKANALEPLPELITLDGSMNSSLPQQANRRDDTLAASSPTSDATVVKHTLRRGETLAELLVSQSVDYAEAHRAITALKKEFNPRSLKAGQPIELTLASPETEETARLQALTIHQDAIHQVKVQRDDSGAFVASSHKKPLTPHLKLAGGTITNSLFETGYANGIPDGILAQLVKAYSYDVDFQREIRRGDQLEVLFESLKTEDGQVVDHGKIVYAKLKLRGEPLTIYHYETQDGESGFFNEKGESVIRALLKTPVNGARISSGFGKRHHPILGYTRMHKGTDFAASTGTPIYAAGDGRVVFAGRNGGYGNFIKIRHNSTYSTAYAHLHRFRKGVRKGSRVKQGEVIGYVGTTGRSTGPHLHYEVHKNGRQVNPMKEKFDAGKKLEGQELLAFKSEMTKIKQQVASMPREKTTLASSE